MRIPTICFSAPIVTLVMTVTALSADRVVQDGEAKFNQHIRPILSKHCIACHGPDEGDRQADLRLDTFTGATADLGGYTAILPGDAQQSEIIVRIVSDDPELRMPPPEHASCRRARANRG